MSSILAHSLAILARSGGWLLAAAVLGACSVTPLPFFEDAPDNSETDAPPADAPGDTPTRADTAGPIDTAGSETEGPSPAVPTPGDAPADRCDEAYLAGPLTQGYFTGDMRGFTGSALRPSCLWIGATHGADAFFKIEVPAGQTFTATYDAFDRDAQLYILRDCRDGSTCVAGADRFVEQYAEALAWKNDSDLPFVGYLVLGIYNAATPPGTYDLTVSLSGP